MLARVRLHVSHVSCCATARREKTPRYKRILNELSEVRDSFHAFALERTESFLHGSTSVLEFPTVFGVFCLLT